MNKTANPFHTGIKNTERTVNQKFVEWINEIIKEEKLPLGGAYQETTADDRKQPDIVILKQPKSSEICLVLELKPPFFDPLDFEAVKEPARKKATTRNSPYFATSNFKTLYLFNTEKANKLEKEEQQIVQKYTLSNMEDMNLIDEPSFKNQIVKNLSIFLRDLSEIVFGKKPESLLPIDEVLISILQEKVYLLSSLYAPIIQDKVSGNPDFRKKLKKWFNEQAWSFVPLWDSYLKAARQTAYLLISKILFYDVLRATDQQSYAKLNIPDDFAKGGMVARHLQNYFAEVLKIDYETIYSADFIDEIAFPDDKNVIYHIKELVNRLNRFDFEQIGYDVLGRIFEGLIPSEERHVLGQYFTQPDIVDLILSFAVRDENDTIFDPGCGAGTFLRRAYHLKKLINPTISHEELLKSLWGNDIAKFPATLATLNLAIANLRSSENYPRIVQKDFFDWMPGMVDLPENTRKAFLKGLGTDEKSAVIPRYFDAIVGNPPYTRQEEMDDLVGEHGQQYKDELIEKALNDETGKKYANITKRAGLHAYFFIHGTKFLKNRGRFGFIVSNSWMDVDYGKGIQEHFLLHYKIKAIIESKVERWFADADVNTSIVLLEKLSGENGEAEKERGDNLVRFVYLKKPLSAFIPTASRIFEETVERKSAVEKLHEYIFSKTSFFENDDLRVYCIKQNELWREGFDEEAQKYVGAKWGKYIRAPQIFFTVLEKGKDKFVSLREIADVRFGIKTGANDFFYLTEEEIKRRGIEEEFWMHKDEKGELIPNYVIKSPRECKGIVVKREDLKYRVLMIHKEKKELQGTKMLEYIKEGEEKNYHKRSTCGSRKNWWDLPLLPRADILYRQFFNEIFNFPLNNENYYCDHTFYYLIPRRKINHRIIIALLNSTLFSLFTELFSRNVMGEGVLIAYGPEIQPIPFINPLKISKLQEAMLIKAINGFGDREILSIYEELGTNNPVDFKMNNVKTDRRKLDIVVMEDILGLSKEEQEDLYKSIIDLTKSRLQRAKSVKKKNVAKQGVDVSQLVSAIVSKAGGNRLGRYYKKNIQPLKDATDTRLPETTDRVSVEQTLLGFRLVSGKNGVDFKTEDEAKYALLFCQAGWNEVKIPKNTDVLKKILLKLDEIKKAVDEAVKDYTEGLLNNSLQSEVERNVWREVSKT